MIRLFTSTETNFNHNKWVLTECTKLIVTENINGTFNVDLEYPLLDSKNLSQYLVKGNIIKCPISTTDTRGEQLFVIRTRTPNTNTKRISIFAECIARYDLGERNFVLGIEIPAGKTRKEATQLLLNGCVEQKGETVGTLDTNANTSINLGLDETTGAVIDYLDIAYVKPLEGLLGDTQSIQSSYGGEIIYNNREINFVDERGSNHSFNISSGKNLQELQQEINDVDSDNFATALIMCSSDRIYLPNNEIIYSSNAATLGNYYKKVVCSNVSAVNSTQEALDIVYAQLREEAQKLFDNGMGQLKINNTINFIQLQNTEEYKDYAILEKCELGNNVTVNYKEANITADGRITETKFNVLWNDGIGRIEEVIIGDKKKSITDIVTNTSTTTNVNTAKVNSVTQQGDTPNDYKMSERAFKECCIGASKNYTKINEEGVTIYDGKFRMYKVGNLIFYVDTNGVCTADGGFVVKDGDVSCVITADGIRLTNSNGYTGLITVDDLTRLLIPDDLNIGKTLKVLGYAQFSGNYVQVDNNLDVDGVLTVGGDTLEDIIDARIAANQPPV